MFPLGLPQVYEAVEMAAHVTPHLSISVHRQMMVEQTAANTVIAATVNSLGMLR